jgi:predicted RNase H-like HicB family nuclease
MSSIDDGKDGKNSMGHTFTCVVRQGDITDEYIAYVKEFRNVVIHTKDKEQILNKMQDALIAYLNAFPEEMTSLLKKQRSQKDTYEQEISIDEDMLKCQYT